MSLTFASNTILAIKVGARGRGRALVSTSDLCCLPELYTTGNRGLVTLEQRVVQRHTRRRVMTYFLVREQSRA